MTDPPAPLAPVPGARRRRTVTAWLPPALWAALIFVLSSLPGDGLPPLPGRQMDKVAHAAVYAVLGALCFRALARTTRLPPPWLIAAAAALAAAYGASDEVHQLYTPGRFADVADAVADLIGGVLGACAIAADRRRRRKMQHPHGAH